MLVTGATGFIGSRLVRALVDEGHRVKAMTRRPDDYAGPADPVAGDVFDPGTLAEPMEGVDVAVYLVHSLDDNDFERKDAEAARDFGLAAAASGVRQIVYMGGLGKDDVELSPHLRSRREVEKLLGSLRRTRDRAARRDRGRRGRHLVGDDPAAGEEPARDGRAALGRHPHPADRDRRRDPLPAGVIGVEKTFGQVYEIGGADRLTYVQMLQQAADVINGRRVPIVTLPVLTPRLSSLWIGLVTNVDSTTAGNLIDSMSTEVLQTDYAIQDIVPGEPLYYREAVERASGRGQVGLLTDAAQRRRAAARTAWSATTCSG